MVTRFLALKQEGGLVAVVEDSVEDLEAHGPSALYICFVMQPGHIRYSESQDLQFFFLASCYHSGSSPGRI